MLRLYTFATACGNERAARVLSDPVVRRLAGVGVDVPQSALVQWIAGCSETDAFRLEQASARWHHARAAIGASHWLLVSAVGRDGAPLTVLLDAERGHWLALRDGEGAAAVPLVSEWITGGVLQPAPAVVWCGDRAQRDAVQALVPGAVPAVRLYRDQAHDPADTSDLAQVMLRLDRLGDELAWSALPSAMQVPAAMARALQSVAQGMLRTLAWRLPGFARATLPHLWANFLSVDAQVLLEPGRMVATLSRPPLAMIVSMTGLFHARYQLPWMSPPLVALFPAEGA